MNSYCSDDPRGMKFFDIKFDVSHLGKAAITSIKSTGLPVPGDGATPERFMTWAELDTAMHADGFTSLCLEPNTVPRELVFITSVVGQSGEAIFVEGFPAINGGCASDKCYFR